MQFTLKLDIPVLPRTIGYSDSILLTGSCFTEHISDRLQQHKFRVLSNPHGILFNPLSVASSLDGYLAGKEYGHNDLFYLNELWNSWDHHTRFSDIDADVALAGINASQRAATVTLKEAGWLIITLGSAFQYYLKENGQPVANNHRAPSQWFEKRLLGIDTIREALGNTLQQLFTVNPSINVLFTISPVRHIRDGVVENNRSKARLIEVVHTLCQNFEQVHYFPAYELLIDVLRDYRFYDIDFVHPNFMATSYVWERFAASCIGVEHHGLMKEINEIITASKHRPRFPETEAHKKFIERHATAVRALQQRFPFLDLQQELFYFDN